MANFQTLNDKKFNSLEIVNCLKIPITDEVDPFGREGEIKYNTKLNSLMIRNQNSWKFFYVKSSTKAIPSAPKAMTQIIEKDTLNVQFENIDEESFDEEIESLIRQAREHDLKKIKVNKLNNEPFISFLKMVYGNKLKIDKGDVEITVN